MHLVRTLNPGSRGFSVYLMTTVLPWRNWKRWCSQNPGFNKVNYESGEQTNPDFVHAKISIRLQTLRVGATPSDKDKI